MENVLNCKSGILLVKSGFGQLQLVSIGLLNMSLIFVKRTGKKKNCLIANLFPVIQVLLRNLEEVRFLCCLLRSASFVESFLLQSFNALNLFLNFFFHHLQLTTEEPWVFCSCMMSLTSHLLTVISSLAISCLMLSLFWFKGGHYVLNYLQYWNLLVWSCFCLSMVNFLNFFLFLKMVMKLISLGIQTSGIGYVTSNNMPLTMSTRSLWVTRLIWTKAKGFVRVSKCLCTM